MRVMRGSRASQQRAHQKQQRTTKGVFGQGVIRSGAFAGEREHRSLFKLEKTRPMTVGECDLKGEYLKMARDE